MKRYRKALVYGKFRVLHAGHLRLFRYANDLADELHVAIDLSMAEAEDAEQTKYLLSNNPLITSVSTFSNFSQMLTNINPDLIVQGYELRKLRNPEVEEIQKNGIQIIYGSGPAYINEGDLASKENGLQLKISIPSEFLKRNLISLSKIKYYIQSFSELKVMVIGDLIVDEYIHCKPLGMSQEEPVIVSTQISRELFLGGAGIVAAHCSALGARATLITLIGQDAAGEWALSQLENSRILTSKVTDLTRPTTLKQRFKNDKQTLFRLNTFRDEEMISAISETIREKFYASLDNVDCVIFSDFSYGVLPFELSREFVTEAKKRRKFVSADSQSSTQMGNLAKFAGAQLITPTEREARIELRDFRSGVAQLANHLRKELSADFLLLKMNADGVLIDGVDEDGGDLITDKIPALNLNPIDVSGAGDSMLVGTSLSLSVGASIHEAALMGSICAAIQISRKGNTSVEASELLNQID